MIQFHASAVVRVSDGFSGRAISNGVLRCVLDDSPVLPQYKPGGYLVFTDLKDGEHTLHISGALYREQSLRFDTLSNQTRFLWAVLQPKPEYPLPKSAVRFSPVLTRQSQTYANQPVWAAVCKTETQLLVAQDLVPAGAKDFRVFCRGKVEQLPVPGAFLILDGESTEAGILLSLTQERATLSQPLQFPHARSVVLYPAQCCSTDEKGNFHLVLRQAGKIILFVPGCGVCKTLDLAQGPCPDVVEIQEGE